LRGVKNKKLRKVFIPPCGMLNYIQGNLRRNRDKMDKKSHIIIVSNRLPFVLKKTENGEIAVEKGAGGLVTAMAPVLKSRKGTWVGWPGYAQEADLDDDILPAIQSAASGYDVKPVMLNSYELKNYYEGFSNSIVWPLFHDSTDKCVFLPDYWKSYRKVNKKFASTVCQHANDSDFLWVHDYQLILVGDQLRKMNIRNQIGFFLHIPFPPVDTFARCPWRSELLSAMLEYDILGFQTIQDKRNFIGCLQKIIPHIGIDIKVEFDEPLTELRMGNNKVRIGAFPISIDYNEIVLEATDDKVNRRVREIRRNRPGNKILLGVDRLDYTKGIPEKLIAFQRFLTLFPKFQNKVHFIQVVVPSRREIKAYAGLRLRIEQLVGEINGIFGTNDWLPVQYMFRSLDKNELISLYRACEVAFIAPLKDGMNLVAKEYCACNIDEKGVLILSEFAGAAQQFYKDAILVNPHDVEGMTSAIYRALTMPLKQRIQRMCNLRQNVKKEDVFWWVDSIFNAAIEKSLSTLPQVDEYFPGKSVNELMS
jgi:trehalose 6-phosphate synthase/phosphatase